MKVNREHLIQKLEFGNIREMVGEYALTPGGKHLASELFPMDEPEHATLALHQTEEYMRILNEGRNLRIRDIGVRHAFASSEKENSWIPAEQLHELKLWLKQSQEIVEFFDRNRESYPLLYQLLPDASYLEDLIAEIDAVLDERGGIKDSASPELMNIRKEIRSRSNALRKIMRRIIHDVDKAGWARETEYTLRNDRLVIPVPVEHKGKVKGFIQDISQSGQTVFIEPADVLEENNQIRTLNIREHNEIIRILKVVTTQVRAHLAELKQLLYATERLDFIRAKAVLAVKLDAVVPQIHFQSAEIQLIKAFHPLLWMKLKPTGQRPVPLNIHLDKSQRILVISGPNAGGKSVSLKTLGLLQAMIQSGLPVPVHPDSTFGWFQSMYMDLGDEQSIQNDLSTYSSHLKNMKVMLDGLHKGSLFLIDEFGSGTDPRLGGAIAEAFLEHFAESGAIGVINTHYGNLKQFAEGHEAVINGAMQFDPQTLTPTFQLETGIPGSSYALEIATKTGIPEKVLDKAREKAGETEVDTEKLLLALEKQKRELERVMEENKAKNAELKRILEKNRELKTELESKRKKIVQQAQLEAAAIIKEANKKIERTIREIKEAQAEKEKTKQLRKELGEMIGQAEEIEEGIKEEIYEDAEERDLKEGDFVRLRSSGSIGQLVEMKENKGIVTIGDMRVNVKLKDVVAVDAPEQKRKATVSKVGVERVAQISSELNVLGDRVEGALPKVQKFIDDAVLANLKEVRILHGKGTGALRMAIRGYLQDLPQVRRLSDAHIDQGGSGWTVVVLE